MIFSQFQGALFGGLTPLIGSKTIPHRYPWEFPTLKLIDALIEEKTILREIEVFDPHFSQLPLILLPLFVYFHDDLATLRQYLDELIANKKLSPVKQEILYLLGSAIAALLRREEGGISLITQLKDNHTNFSLVWDLALIQESLEKGIPVNQFKRKFYSQLCPEFRDIVVILLCLCDTPDSPYLSLLRVYALRPSLEMLGLIGALVGAVQGLSGLPSSWQFRWRRNPNNEIIMAQINRLWQKWTGNMKTDFSDNLGQTVAVPLVMQPRPSLKLISHQEYLNFPLISNQTQSSQQ